MVDTVEHLAVTLQMVLNQTVAQLQEPVGIAVRRIVGGSTPMGSSDSSVLGVRGEVAARLRGRLMERIAAELERLVLVSKFAQLGLAVDRQGLLPWFFEPRQVRPSLLDRFAASPLPFASMVACCMDNVPIVFAVVRRMSRIAVAADRKWRTVVVAVVDRISQRVFVDDLVSCHALLESSVAVPRLDCLLVGTYLQHSFERRNCMAVCPPRRQANHELHLCVLDHEATMPGNGKMADGWD